MFRHSDPSLTLAQATPQIDHKFGFYAPETAQANFNAMHPKQELAGRWPFSVIRRMWRDWANDRHLRQSIVRLNSLSQHLLDDVGLYQSDSEQIYNQSEVQTVNKG